MNLIVFMGKTLLISLYNKNLNNSRLKVLLMPSSYSDAYWETAIKLIKAQVTFSAVI